MKDPLGRWFSFCATPETIIILEKKNLPEHLVGLPCVDSPSYLSTVLRELQDSGEARDMFSTQGGHLQINQKAESHCNRILK